MNTLYAFIGLIFGGMVGLFGGAIAGGVVGWLCGAFVDLRQRQEKQGQELALLRTRLAEHLREGESAPAPEEAPAQRKEPVAPVIRPHTPPDFVPPVELMPSAVPAPEPEIIDLTPADEFVFEAEPRQPFAPQPPRPTGLTATNTMFLRLFNGENLLVKLGVVILFFGVSFLVKYAAQHGLFPIQMRLLASAAGGCALLGTGWRLREKRAEYALALQGGGIGILYLTVYAAFRLFALIPPWPAFGLLVAVSCLCSALAVLQDARTLALFGVSGGFVAPLLASIGSGDPQILFGYYAVLNAGIIGVAWFRSWRSLNLAGFVGTFIVGTLWGARFYTPANFGAVEPFLVLFFLMYLVVAVLFAFRQPPDLKGMVDATLVFGTPIVAFALQAGLVERFRYGLAWSALAAGIIYCLLGGALRRCGDKLRLLAEAFLAFGIVFLTLAVPLAFDGRWTSAAWALEGAAMIWAGFRQERWLLRGFGILLQFGAGAAFLTELVLPAGSVVVLNAICLGSLLISLAGLASSRIILRNSHRATEYEALAGRLLTAWGIVWWFGCGLNEIGDHVPHHLVYNARLAFIALSGGICHLAERRLVWHDLARPTVLLLPALACYALLGEHHHPAANFGWLAWPLALGIAWGLLWARDAELDDTVQGWLHGIGVWLPAGLVTWELGWQLWFFLSDRGSWFIISRGIVPMLLLALIVAGSQGDRWPLGWHRETYLGLVTLPLAVWGLIWTILASVTQAGDSWPFPWLPLLNQLDLACLFGIAIVTLWMRELGEVPTFRGVMEQTYGLLQGGMTVVTFLWLNSVLARTLHHWGGVPFNLDALCASTLAQTCYTLFWSLLALCLMVVAVRRVLRSVWLCGAGLLGLVVLKLFLVDLANHGTVERIVSFVAVGLLMLVIGWFAPVPPRSAVQ